MDALMRIICRLLVPTQGRVTVGGLDVVAHRREVRRLFGYVSQTLLRYLLTRNGGRKAHAIQDALGPQAVGALLADRPGVPVETVSSRSLDAIQYSVTNVMERQSSAGTAASSRAHAPKRY